MDLDELKNMPLTVMENTLKQYTALHPEWLSNIVSAMELSDFLMRLYEYGNKSNNLENFFVQLVKEAKNSKHFQDRMTESKETIIETTLEKSLLKFLGKDSDDLRNCQQEKTFIPQKFDISVGRMHRYMPAHWHTNDYFELYYVFAGNCHLHFDNEVVALSTGTVFLLSPTSYHASPCYSDDCILMYYMIRTSTFNRVFWNNLKEQNMMSAFFRKVLNGEGGKSYLHFETGNDQKIQNILFEIYQEYEAGDHHSPQMMNALMSTFFIQLLRGYINKVQLPTDMPISWNPQFSEIFTYIQNNYREVTLKQLAERFSYSERQLARIIHAATNKNFLEVLLEIRMQQAAGYLTMTEQSAEKIAELVGYGNASSFYRAFMKFYGVSPSGYRKMEAGIVN